MKTVAVKDFLIGEGQPLALMSGPCVIESEEMALSSAQRLVEMCQKLDIHLIYKSSYDKANRSAGSSFRGPGIKKGLKILEKVRSEFGVPILTDVHTPEEALEAGSVCDVIQIPAFLCRQTDLILAAATTKAVINVKKGQFLAPGDMKNVIDKIQSQGHDQIILTERGSSFGYHNLVCDMRGIPIMQSLGYPVCFDASHAVQLPGGLGTSTGGERQFIPTLARSSIAAGANCLFIESHPDPSQAKSDRGSVYPLDGLYELLRELKELYTLIQTFRAPCLPKPL